MKDVLTLKVYIHCLKRDRRVSLWSNPFRKIKNICRISSILSSLSVIICVFLSLLGNKQQAIFLVQHLDLFPGSLNFILFSLSCPPPPNLPHFTLSSNDCFWIIHPHGCVHSQSNSANNTRPVYLHGYLSNLFIPTVHIHEHNSTDFNKASLVLSLNNSKSSAYDVLSLSK